MFKSIAYAPVILALVAAATAQTPKPKTPGAAMPMVWVDPDRNAPEGMKYRTFHSKTIGAEVSYMVYLPPEYFRANDPFTLAAQTAPPQAPTQTRPLIIYLVRPDFPDQTAMMTFLKQRLTDKDFYLPLPLPGRSPGYASDLPGQRLYPAGNLEGIKRHIGRVKEKGRSGWIVFDLELPPPNVKVSPELEAAHKDFVKSVEGASKLTRASGWKFILTPVYPDIRKHAAAFAPLCDAVVLQVPHFLPDYRGAVRAAVQQIKSVNPKCLVFVQLGPRKSTSGRQKVNDDFDGLTRAWDSVHDLVDGILVYFFNQPDPIPGLKQFYDHVRAGPRGEK